jgi:hypothetical protein
MIVTNKFTTLGVFGGLDLFGKDTGTPWTRLVQTVNSGSVTIKLEEPVKWRSGDDIVVGGTSFGQAEVFKIVNVEPDKVTINLNTSVRYRYIGTDFNQFYSRLKL